MRVLRVICHQKALLAIKDSYFTRLLEISKYAFVIYYQLPGHRFPWWHGLGAQTMENFDVFARYFIKLLKRPAAGDLKKRILYFQAIFKHFWNFCLNKVHFQIFFQKVGKVGEKSKSRRKVGEMAKK